MRIYIKCDSIFKFSKFVRKKWREATKKSVVFQDTGRDSIISYLKDVLYRNKYFSGLWIITMFIGLRQI